MFFKIYAILKTSFSKTLSALKATLASLIAGEDLTNDVLKVEQRYPYFTEVSADGALKSTAGFVHRVVISCTTAGTLVLRDSTTAGGGTVIHTLTVPVGIWDLELNYTFSTGFYADYGTMVGTVNGCGR